MKVAYIAYQYPTLTQTFIQREVKAVAAAGIPIEVHAMRGRQGDPNFQMPDGTTLHRFFLWRLIFLFIRVPIELIRDPGLIPEGIEWLRTVKWRGVDNILINLLGLGFAFSTASRFRRSDVDHFHGVWATGMSSAAGLLARMTGKTFSMGAHAFDIYRFGGDMFLAGKLARASFVHTTTEANVRYLKALSPRANIILSRRGLESLPDVSHRHQRKTTDPFSILSVARLIPKKGLEYQIKICAELKSRGFSFVHQIVGDGPLRLSLHAQIKSSGLGKEVFLLGALSQSEVQNLYTKCDLFWHAGLVDSEGDRDGLPNVIPEAFSWELCVLSSPTPGADEAVCQGETGWIADPLSINQSVESILNLAKDDDLRSRLGRRGRQWVEQNFMSSKNSLILVDAFRSRI